MTTPVARARASLRGHALLNTFNTLPLERQEILANLADALVDDVATATQNRMFLRGDCDEDILVTSALFGNGLCALLRVPPEDDE